MSILRNGRVALSNLRVKGHIHSKTQTDTHTHRHTHIHSQRQTQIQTGIHRNRQTHTGTVIHTLTHTHTHTQTHKHTHTYTLCPRDNPMRSVCVSDSPPPVLSLIHLTSNSPPAPHTESLPPHSPPPPQTPIPHPPPRLTCHSVPGLTLSLQKLCQLNPLVPEAEAHINPCRPDSLTELIMSVAVSPGRSSCVHCI